MIVAECVLGMLYAPESGYRISEEAKVSHPYDFFLCPRMLFAGRGCRTNRLSIFTVNEHNTAPEAKYATPADRVYRRNPAVRLVTMAFVCVVKLGNQLGSGMEEIRSDLVQKDHPPRMGELGFFVFWIHCRSRADFSGSETTARSM